MPETKEEWKARVGIGQLHAVGTQMVDSHTRTDVHDNHTVDVIQRKGDRQDVIVKLNKPVATFKTVVNI